MANYVCPNSVTHMHSPEWFSGTNCKYCGLEPQGDEHVRQFSTIQREVKVFSTVVDNAVVYMDDEGGILDSKIHSADGQSDMVTLQPCPFCNKGNIQIVVEKGGDDETIVSLNHAEGSCEHATALDQGTPAHLFRLYQEFASIRDDADSFDDLGNLLKQKPNANH